MILPCVISNSKVSITYSFSIKKLYTFGITNTVLFSFVRLWRKLPYISLMTAFMLNIFGKDYRRNFIMILSCHHLHHRLPLLD